MSHDTSRVKSVEKPSNHFQDQALKQSWFIHYSVFLKKGPYIASRVKWLVCFFFLQSGQNPFKINIILNFSVCSMRSPWSSVPSFNISTATLSTQTDCSQSRKTDTGSELSVKPPAIDSWRSSGCHVSYLFSCWSLCSSWRQTEALHLRNRERENVRNSAPDYIKDREPDLLLPS